MCAVDTSASLSWVRVCGCVFPFERPLPSSRARGIVCAIYVWGVFSVELACNPHWITSIFCRAGLTKGAGFTLGICSPFFVCRAGLWSGAPVCYAGLSCEHVSMIFGRYL